MATRPTIEIDFKQLATTAIERSERGTAILLLNDDTNEDTAVKIYKDITEIDETLYTDDSIEHIKACMAYAPYEVVVISKNSTNLADFTKEILKIRNTGWIAFAGLDSVQSDLASWVKSQENMGRTYKVIGTVAKQDCKHYVYFNQAVIDNEGNGVQAVDYLSSLLGLIASCNINKSCTNHLCADADRVDEVSDIDVAVKAGQLVLTNDIGGVKIVTGCNSLVTLNGNTATEDMQYIETVEAMDLIRDDIKSVFKETYQGKFKNKYKYQMLFVGAVRQYYSQLANEDILDDEYDNTAEIDINAQRSAWLGSGKTEAEDWDDDTVKRMAFKRSVFLKCNIKILNCMENLKFTVELV